MPANAMPRKMNSEALTTAPSNPHTPKSTNISSSSRPEANPAPTITPTNAPAIFRLSFMTISLELLLLGLMGRATFRGHAGASQWQAARVC